MPDTCEGAHGESPGDSVIAKAAAALKRPQGRGRGSREPPVDGAGTDVIVIEGKEGLHPVDHAIIAIGAYNPVSTTVSGYAQALQGATSLSEVVKESQNSAGYQYMGIVSKQSLTATSTTCAATSA